MLADLSSVPFGFATPSNCVKLVLLLVMGSNFLNGDKIHITLTSLTVLSVQSKNVKYIYMVVKPVPGTHSPVSP